MMTDPASLGTLDVLTKALPPALFTDSNLLPLTICRAVNLTLERGNSDGSCVAYVWLGQLAGPHFGNYRDGFRFGQLGYDLVEKHGLKRFQARTYMVFGSHVVPWTKHLRTGRDLIHRASEVANKIGDLCFAVYSRANLNTNLLAAGDPLGEVQREAEKGLEFAQKAGFGFVIDAIAAQLGLIRTLRGLTPKFGSFDDGQFDELRFERHLANDPVTAQPVCFYWIRKLQAGFFTADYVSALDAALKAEPLLWTAPSNLEQAVYHLYGGLCRAALWDSASPDQRRQHFKALAAHEKQLQIWAENCPENFENHAALLGAEIARIEGRQLDAEKLYEQAIQSAHANGFVHLEALANELAARFYAARGFAKIANAYLRDARYGYLRWGADGKVRQLEELYPQLREEKPLVGPTNTIGTPVEHLDLATIIEVSQAVSGEMVFEKLIDRLMCTAIENAGAERGLLILLRGNEQRIEAEALATGDAVTLRRREAVVGAMPESIVQYVARTRENVLLENAAAQNPFSADAYIRERRARSILCLPLIHQGKFIGVLYLENNQTPYVFTPTRIAVLKMLVSQAAISLENTRLYADLQERESKIRRLVDANILGIFFCKSSKFNGQITEANEAFLNMIQSDREDLASGRLRWTDLTPPEWRDRDKLAEAELMANGSAQPFEKEYFRRDGSRVPVLAGGAIFELGGNEGVGFALDLTEQKRAEEALRRSEAYLAEAQSLSHSGSWYWNVRTGEVTWSREYCAIFGFDFEKDKPSYELFIERVHPEDRAKVEQVLWVDVREKRDFHGEYRLLRPDGVIKSVLSIGRCKASQSGDVEYIGAVIDTTERKRAEEALRRSETYLAEAQRLSHTGSFGWDVSSGEVYWSAETFRIFEHQPISKVTVEMVVQRTHPEDRAFVQRLLDTVSHERKDFDIEHRLLMPDGSTKHVRVVGHPSTNSESGHFEFVGAVTDTTDRKRAEEERERLHQLEADLAHINRVSTMGELTASLAHEIKQPMFAAATDAETCLRWLARDQADVVEAQQAALRLIKDVSRASDIINRIVALFKKRAPQRELVDVDEVVQEMITLLRSEASRYSISIHAEFTEGLPKLMADRVALQQVLMNLMLNAIEAMKDTGTPGKLTITTRQDENRQILISVTDTGVGLPPALAEQVFTAFFSSKPQGTGMGLPISRSIIESHGGRLWATSNSGAGATFQFTLPLEAAARQSA
jgi:PAS domain S-box-containing protein